MSNNSSAEFADHGGDHSIADTVILVLLVTLSLATIAANVLVMLAIVFERKLHKLSNYLLFSLSMADFLTGLLVMPVLIMIAYFQYFLLSCEFVYIVESVVNIASIYHVFAISIDRYLNIVFFKHSLTRSLRRIVILILISWIVPLVTIIVPKLCAPTVYYDTIADPHECRLELNDYFKHIRLAVNYYLPFGAIIFMNCHIFYVGRKSIAKRSSNTSSVSTTTSSSSGSQCLTANACRLEGKLRKTIAAIILAFMVCWCPFVAFVYAVEPFMARRNLLVFHSLFWLALSNSLLNALIYAFSISEVLVYAKKILRLK